MEGAVDVESLEVKIAEFAKHSGLVLNDKGQAGWGAAIGIETEIPEHVGEEKGYSQAVWPWRRLMVECINYLSIQALAHQRMLDNEEQRNSFFRALFSQSVAAASDAICVLHLADQGYVRQSAIVAQSCKESIEACALFTIDPSVVDEFVEAETLDEANSVWYKTIRNSRKAIDKALSELAPRDQNTSDWMHHTNRLLGAQKHPTHLGPMLDIFTEWEERRPGRLMLPARSLGCVKIFQTIAATCFERASVTLLAVHGPRTETNRVIEAADRPYAPSGFFDEAWLDSYASSGHKFMQHLWIFYLQHQNDPPFVLWRQNYDEEAT